MSFGILQEEIGVLESIYSSELSKISERELLIFVEPEELRDNEDEIKLSLKVVYPEEYPNTLPLLEFEDVQGELDEVEIDDLMSGLKTLGQENLGIAMTFSLVSHLREQLSLLAASRLQKQRKEEHEKARRAQEEEDARTRGTSVTPASFKEWKVKFGQEMTLKKTQEEELLLKNLSIKEREEWKRIATRLTGRQQFERDSNLAISDASFVEEGTVSVDASQYDRIKNDAQDDAQVERLSLSDSD